MEVAERIEINGTVNLILCDDATLDAKQGVNVHEDSELIIWAQDAGTGALNAIAEEMYCFAGIGGNECEASGSVTINGGIITAVGCEGGAGIGGGLSAPGGTVVINAGTVTAEAGTYAQAIGHGFDEAYWNGDTDEELAPGTITLATGLAVSYGDEL